MLVCYNTVIYRIQGGSKRRLRRQLRNQPVVEGVTVETQKAGASKRTESGKRKQEVPSQASQRPTHNATKAKPTSGDVASLDLLLFKSPSQVVAGPSHQTPGTGSQGDVQATKRDSNTPEADQCFSFPSTPCTPRSLPDDSSPVCSASPPADNCGAFFEPSTEPNRAVQNSIAHRGTPERPTKVCKAPSGLTRACQEAPDASADHQNVPYNCWQTPNARVTRRRVADDYLHDDMAHGTQLHSHGAYEEPWQTIQNPISTNPSTSGGLRVAGAPHQEWKHRVAMQTGPVRPVESAPHSDSNDDGLAGFSADLGTGSQAPREPAAFAHHRGILQLTQNRHPYHPRCSASRGTVFSCDTDRKVAQLQSFDLHARAAASTCSPTVMEPAMQHIYNPHRNCTATFQAASSSQFNASQGTLTLTGGHRAGNAVPLLCYGQGDHPTEDDSSRGNRLDDFVTATTRQLQPYLSDPAAHTSEHSAVTRSEPVTRSEKLLQLVKQSRQLLCKPPSAALVNTATRSQENDILESETVTVLEL